MPVNRTELISIELLPEEQQVCCKTFHRAFVWPYSIFHADCTDRCVLSDIEQYQGGSESKKNVIQLQNGLLSGREGLFIEPSVHDSPLGGL